MSWDQLDLELAELFGSHANAQCDEYSFTFAAERVLERTRDLMAQLYARRKSAKTCAKCDLPPEHGQTRCAAHRAANKTACLKAYRNRRAKTGAVPFVWTCRACGGAGHNARTCAQRRAA